MNMNMKITEKSQILDAEARLRTPLNNKNYRKVNKDHPGVIYGFWGMKFGRNTERMSIAIDIFLKSHILKSRTKCL